MTASRSGVAILCDTLATDRGGRTRAVLNRIKLLDEHGVSVRVLLLTFSLRQNGELAKIRRTWGLSEDVEFRQFWRDAAPQGGGRPADAVDLSREEPGFTTTRRQIGKTTLIEFYEEGLLRHAKRFGQNGQLELITRYNEAGRAISQDHFDDQERLVQRRSIDMTTGVPTIWRWFTESGQVWLTSWHKANREATRVVRHHPIAVAFETFGHCVAEWVDDVTSDWEHPVVIADKRAHDSVLWHLKHTGVRTIAALHGCHTKAPHRSSDPPMPGYQTLIDHLSGLSAMVVLSGQQKQDIERLSKRGHIVQIPHPAPDPNRSQKVYTTEGRVPGRLVVVSRLVKHKRVDHIIRAFAIATEKVPYASLDIYGNGEEEDSLRKLANQLGVGKKVVFKGYTDRPLAAFATGTASALASVSEGLALVLVEGMSVGTPFVSYDINYGPAEYVRDGFDGLLVEPGNIDELARGLISVLADAEYAATLGKNATEVSARFSRERWESEWLSLYKELIAPHGASH